MTTLTDEELGTVTNGDVSTDDKVYRGTFEGRLVGTATTAKQLEVPFKLELQGDVAGNVDISGKQGVILQTTVSHATEADRAEYAGKTALATNANYADLANLANFAVESGKAKQAEHADEAEHAKETDHALKSDTADLAKEATLATRAINADKADLATKAIKDDKDHIISETYAIDTEVVHKSEYLTNAIVKGLASGTGTIKDTTLTITIDKLANEGLNLFEFVDFPTVEGDRDTTKIYISQEKKQFYIYNTVTQGWENVFDTFNQALQDIATKHNTDVQTLLDTIKSTKEELQQSIDTNRAEVDKTISDTDTALRLVIQNTKENLTTQINTAKSDLSTAIANTNADLTDLINTNRSEVDTSLIATKDELNTAINTTKSDVLNELNTQVTTLNTSISTLETNTTNSLATKAPIDSPTFTTECLVPEPTKDNSAVTKSYLESKLISSTTNVTLNDIGIAGRLGFGVGVCPYSSDKLLEYGFVGASGYDDILSYNYGNYNHKYGGMYIWIPKFYYRKGNENASTYATYGVNAIEVKPASAFKDRATARANGWELHRAFIDNGKEVQGFFISKFACAIVTANGKTYPVSTLTATPSVNITAVQDIDHAHSLGNGFNVTSCFQRAAVDLLTLCHAQNAKWSDSCAWYDSTLANNAPTRGNGRSNYYTAPMTFAKYTHNGQVNGMSDIGYIWEFNLGITTPATTATEGASGGGISQGKLYILNESVRLADITSGFNGDTDAWGTTATLTSHYHTRTFPITFLNGTKYWGNGSEDCLGDITDELFMAMPLSDTHMSSSGVNFMLNSPIFLNLANNLAYYVGGQVIESSWSGYNKPFSRSFISWRSGSYSTTGFRASCYLDD